MLLVLSCLLRLQEHTGAALRIKCSHSGSFFLHQLPHTAPARGTNTFVCGQAELSQASLSCICTSTHRGVLCLNQRMAHLKFRSMLQLKNTSEITSWKRTDILESNNVKTAPNKLKQRVGDKPEQQIIPALQLEMPFSSSLVGTREVQHFTPSLPKRT